MTPVVMGGFVTSPPLTLEASKDEDDNDDAIASDDEDDNDDTIASDDEDDEDASSSSVDKMSTWYSYPLSLVTKRGTSFGYESSHS